MARVIKALQQNAEWGENRPAHREHRSKRGRNKMWKIKSEAFLKYKRKKMDMLLDEEYN
jgi:hypothetical protein